MNRRTKQIGAVLALLAMAFFSFWGFWYWVKTSAVSDLIRARTQEAVEKNPQLKSEWDQAIADQVLDPFRGRGYSHQRARSWMLGRDAIDTLKYSLQSSVPLLPSNESRIMLSRSDSKTYQSHREYPPSLSRARRTAPRRPTSRIRSRRRTSSARRSSGCRRNSPSARWPRS